MNLGSPQVVHWLGIAWVVVMVLFAASMLYIIVDSELAARRRERNDREWEKKYGKVKGKQ